MEKEDWMSELSVDPATALKLMKIGNLFDDFMVSLMEGKFVLEAATLDTGSYRTVLTISAIPSHKMLKGELLPQGTQN